MQILLYHSRLSVIAHPETRLTSVGRNCVIRVAQFLIALVQFQCEDCSPLVCFQVQLRETREL